MKKKKNLKNCEVAGGKYSVLDYVAIWAIVGTVLLLTMVGTAIEAVFYAIVFVVVVPYWWVSKKIRNLLNGGKL